MPFQPGDRLGSYEILSTLGAGGMGVVYRARDSKLGREVAIKTLPEEVAADGERLARFEREARALAALNHVNVASIYGFEQAGAARLLVMELVSGETLADWIARGSRSSVLSRSSSRSRQGSRRRTPRGSSTAISSPRT
jgi:serine/threonine protein kinase